MQVPDVFKVRITFPGTCWSGQGFHSWYSDSPWAGQAGDQIPVGARLSAPVQTSPRAQAASYTMSTGPLSWA